MAKRDLELELDIDRDDEEQGENAQEKSSGKSKLIIFAAAGVLLLGAAIGATLLLGGDETAADETAEASEEVEVKAPAQYVTVPQPITSNLPGAKRNRTVQIKVAFMVRSDEAAEAIKTHLPQLNNDFLMLVSQQSADELQTPEGRVKLQQQALATAQQSLSELVGQPTVEKVLFTSFVMQ